MFTKVTFYLEKRYASFDYTELTPTLLNQVSPTILVTQMVNAFLTHRDNGDNATYINIPFQADFSTDTRFSGLIYFDVTSYSYQNADTA